jgi:hypothetical protein
MVSGGSSETIVARFNPHFGTPEPAGNGALPRRDILSTGFRRFFSSC